MTKIALVDQDHVLAHWLPGMTNILRDICKREGRDFPLPDVQTDWELLTGDEATDQLIYEALDHPELYSSLEPVDGAVKGLETLEDVLGYTVFICTSPSLYNPTCASQKVEWVAQHLGNRWKSRVVMTNDKTLVRGDILIDDKPTVTGVMCPTWEHIIFDAPYNQNSQGRRLYNWSEVEALLTPRESKWLKDGTGWTLKVPVNPEEADKLMREKLIEAQYRSQCDGRWYI